MKAKEVLKRYAAGEREFRRAILRGQKFQGQDLSEADFSEADIRGTNFANANLTETNFTGAKAGLQKRCFFGQWLLLLGLFILVGILQGYFSYYLASDFPRWWDFSYKLTSSQLRVSALSATIAYLIVLIVIIVAIARQGFTTRAAGSIAVTTAIVVAVTSGVAGAVIDKVGVAPLVAVPTTVLIAGAVLGAFTFAVTDTVAGTVAGAVAAAVSDIVVVKIATVVSTDDTGSVAVIVAVAIVVMSFLLGIYSSRRVAKGDEKFALIRAFGVAFGALGGTSFNNANLTRANFTDALLKNSNFRQATLTQICWHQAQKLNAARMGDSILADAVVRELLISRNGYNKSYVNADLRGANLNGVNLEQADLKGANLSQATLHQAHLKAANLREVLAIGADFSGAYLTAACLEAWNIDDTTKLDGVDCQYVFLLEQPNQLGSRERRPHEPDQVFAPGDFEKLYNKMRNVVQVLLRNGMNRAAFAEAFQKLMDDHPDLSYDSIQAVERKGNDVLVTLEVSKTADKAEISRSLREAYEDKVQQLAAKVEQLHELRAADLKEVALSQKAQVLNQLVGRDLMEERSSQNINVGRDLTLSGSTLNLGEISGNVTNAINQLPNTVPDHPDLKTLLTQLQEAIESGAELSTEDKADLLEQVKTLAEVQQTEPEKQEGVIRKARKIFDATLKTLPDTAKVVEACSKLLPLILKALGVPV